MRDMGIEAVGNALSPAGVSISALTIVSYYLFIMVVVPLYSKRDSIILTCCMILIPLVPALPWMPGAAYYGVLEQGIIILCLVVAYYVIRKIKITNAEFTLRLQENNMELWCASYTDPLTRVLSRRALSEYVTWMREKSGYEKIGVVIFDIDDFKKYNDNFSHVEGDEVLIRVADCILSLSDEDQFVFRYGGEEFVIVLPDADDDDLIEYGRKINEGIWETDIERNDVLAGRVTITVGCAKYLFTYETIRNDIISAADNQLYTGKRSGKDCVVCCNRVFRFNKSVQSFKSEVAQIAAKPVSETRNIALIIDDMELNREILSDIISDRFNVVEAENGQEAIEKIEEFRDSISIIFLDLIMPVKDGFAVLEYMNKDKLTDKIPVFIISGENSQESEKRCLDYGVSDFIPKPFNPNLLQIRVSNALERFSYRDLLKNKVAEQLKELHEKNVTLSRTNDNIIEVMGDLVEARSKETGLHVRRIKEFTRTLAHSVLTNHPELGLTEEKIAIMVSVCPLHDVGKIMISDAILNKPGRLTPEEYKIMKTHTTLGCEIIDSAKNIWGDEYHTTAYEICRSHHERYDGSGYPDGFIGEEIPLSAQIVSIADVYDALVAERVYKKPYSGDTAYKMITNGECGAFSPVILDSFSHCKEEFEELSKTIVADKLSGSII